VIVLVGVLVLVLVLVLVFVIVLVLVPACVLALVLVYVLFVLVLALISVLVYVLVRVLVLMSWTGGRRSGEPPSAPLNWGEGSSSGPSIEMRGSHLGHGSLPSSCDPQLSHLGALKVLGGESNLNSLSV
jgi:hypothetical protein